MTMPRKGLRKIHIDNVEYPYVIKKHIYGNSSICGGNVTVSLPDGSFLSNSFDEEITPSKIKVLINTHYLLKNKKSAPIAQPG